MYRCESWTIGQLSAKELMLFLKLFFYFKFIFQWKIRASQNCVGVRGVFCKCLVTGAVALWSDWVRQCLWLGEGAVKVWHNVSTFSKGNQPWIFIGRTDVEAEAPILWSPDGKSQLIGKDPDAGKNWGQEKGMIEDKMVRWHHWLNGFKFQQTLGDSEGMEA